MRKKVRIGLVGYKFMGKAHSNAYRKIGMFFDPSADIEMTAICGREEEWVRDSATKFGWQGYETRWEDMIVRPDIDVIDITSPSNTHKDIAIAAAREGKHVFCEKPLALSANDAREMLQVANECNIKHQVGFNYRFAPAVLLAKKFIDEGKIGQIFHFRGNYLQDYIIDPTFPRVWRLDKSIAGSGAHGDLGAHVIDLARFLVGDIKNVCGHSKTFIKERPAVEKMQGLSANADMSKLAPVTVDDATMFMAEFECGALGLFESTRFAAGHKNALTFEINGSRGSVRFKLERFNELEYFSRDDEEGAQGFRTIGVTEGSHPYMTHWWPPAHIIGYEHTFVHELYEFVECVANDKPCVPSFADGLKCCQVLDAVDVSIEKRGWISVDEL